MVRREARTFPVAVSLSMKPSSFRSIASSIYRHLYGKGKGMNSDYAGHLVNING